jgi:hypothetical protein
VTSRMRRTKIRAKQARQEDRDGGTE